MLEGYKTEFVYKERHLFYGFNDEDSTFLSSAEKQYLIRQCMNGIIVTDIESIPGVTKATLYKDRPVGKQQFPHMLQNIAGVSQSVLVW